MIMEEKRCQCCGMPLVKAEDFGAEKDGSACAEFCCHCWQDGAFTEWCANITMEEMIEWNTNFCFEHGMYKTIEESRAANEALYPTLKRWKVA